MPDITRETILRTLRDALESLDYVYAMWEAGAAAFKRVDEWSDLDLLIDVGDERVADTLNVIDETLKTIAPIELKYELPQPTWHGHAQNLYRVRGTSDFLMLDIAVIKHSNPNKFLQPEIHGTPVVHFDKSNVVHFQSLDRDVLLKQIEGRLDTLRVTFDLFQVLVLKEVNRKNYIEAFAYYQGFTLRPLIEALRIKYAPLRYNFHTRYIYYEFPHEITGKLEPLFFVASGEDLHARREEAERLFKETLAQITTEEIAKLLEQ